MKGITTIMTNLQLVIFDMDGVMFDTERLFKSAYRKFGKINGYEFSDEIFEKITGASSKVARRTFFNAFGKDFPYEEAVAYREKSAHDIIENRGIPIKYGLMNIIAFLKKNNIKIAVASSSKMINIKYNLQKAAVRNIDFIISGEDIKESKPNPEIFLKCCEKFNISPNNAIVLEDSLNGIKAALSAKINPIWIPDLINIPDEFMSKIFAKADNLIQVIDIIQENFNTKKLRRVG